MGDFNFPGTYYLECWLWSNYYTNYGSSLNKLFLNDASLEQFVHLPKRQDSVLDLVLSPYLKISNLDIIPGTSDHDAKTFDLIQSIS